MTSGPAVADSSTLIGLAQIRQLAILRRLFGTILIPPAVNREIRPSVILPEWISERPLTQTPDLSLGSSLVTGEREAINLAVQVTSHVIVLDDLDARITAERLGLTVVGTLGLLPRAKQQRFIPAIRPLLDALIASRFFVASDLYQRVLESAGEA